MHFNRLDLNLLLALDALLAECNTTRAAQRLNLSQSAASGALARLRDYFGDELLIPVGRNMVMTPLAARLRQPIREALQQLRMVLDSRTEFVARESTRHFHVIASDYAVEVVLVAAIQRLSELAPGITIDILPVEASCADQMQRCRADLALLPAPAAVEHLRQEVLIEDHLACLAWRGNTLLHNRLTVDQYHALGHVASACSGMGSALPGRHLVGAHAAPRVEVRTRSVAQIPALLANTNRIAIVNSRLAQLYARQFPLRHLSLAFDAPMPSECMQWLKVYDHDPAHVWLRQLLRETAKMVTAR